ncbi:HAD-IIA family hydrolase [Marivita sp. S2033]|uniref:HAD-IIA family hydrolase n=1 Tax=Marivita sp. S2033 TaxID=3373187 RepID=UPI003982CF20
MTAETAFAAYEAVRHRLPAVTATETAHQQVGTIADIADRFDVFLLDAFGVLNIGETAIAGTRERIDDLRAAGKRVIVVSNAASVPVSDLVAKYRRLGYDFAAEDILTSRMAMVTGLARKKPCRWGVMAGEMPQFADLGALDLTLLESEPDTYDAVDGFLLVGSATWTHAQQQLLEKSMSSNPRPMLVANPDIVAPRETGFSTEPGHFAHLLADRTGVSPEFFGKPFANIYDMAFAKLRNSDRSRVLMVGDSLHTDILGAQTAGIASALVTDFGFFAGHDVESAIRRSGIVPTFTITRP